VTRDLDDLRELQLRVADRPGDGGGRTRPGGVIALDPFARRVLKQPERVLQVLASFSPMADVDRSHSSKSATLAESLATLYDAPSTPRMAGFRRRTRRGTWPRVQGRLHPGLAERVFRGDSEDPLLADDPRGSATSRDRRSRCARALDSASRLARRPIASTCPSRDSTRPARARAVLLRARADSRVTGEVPTRRDCRKAPRRHPVPRWPCRAAMRNAIDDFEHDLSVLRTLMTEGPPPEQAQHRPAQPARASTLTSQYQRARSTGRRRRARAIDRRGARVSDTHRLGARAYSASALQHYAACRTAFCCRRSTACAHRGAGAAAADGSLNRGSFVHQVQADVLRAVDESLLLRILRIAAV
jgi:hypothetical protein